MKKFEWVTPEARVFLSRGYIQNQTVEERYWDISQRVEELSGIKGIAESVFEYSRRGLLSFSSPILSNFGKNTGLPISCNFGVVDDTLQSILSGLHEMGMLAKGGAGTAKHMSAIRPVGSPYGKDGLGISEGMVSWIKEYANIINKVTQGGVRRGFLSVYCDADHDEIDNFLNIGANGDPNNASGYGIQNITTGVTIPKGWMQSMLDGDKKKRSIWAKILKRRSEIGFPYILFADNCNENKPQVYIDKGMDIFTSNICTEVIEYCDSEKEFTCCLMSLNLIHYDEWPEDLIWLANIILDCVLTEYLEKTDGKSGYEKARKFVEEHRAIGLGVIGFHSLLQSKMIPFGSIQSYQLNDKIFKQLREQSDYASRWMAEHWGEPEVLKGYGLRNTTRLAIAPTKSTSFIMGDVSKGVELEKSNYLEKRLAKIQVTHKNPYLKAVLENHGEDNRSIWKSILDHNGSVQHLEFLTELEREVFKTFSECSQADVIKLAAQRQKYIDQGQSINLMMHPKTPPKDVHNLIVDAWQSGLKTLYYQYSINAAQQFNESLMQCSSCEG